jgi:hypothetical protein
MRAIRETLRDQVFYPELVAVFGPNLSKAHSAKAIFPKVSQRAENSPVANHEINFDWINQWARQEPLHALLETSDIGNDVFYFTPPVGPLWQPTTREKQFADPIARCVCLKKLEYPLIELPSVQSVERNGFDIRGFNTDAWFVESEGVLIIRCDWVLEEMDKFIHGHDFLERLSAVWIALGGSLGRGF